jgi:NADPH:quinone reductase-like Zn-dependent oxidoreductase
MRAIVQDTYGEVDVLQLRDIRVPVPADDEVLVRVGAAEVDQGAWHLMTGLPYLVRMLGFGVRAPRTRVRGLGFAGQIDAVGAKVRGLQPGDEVFGVCQGAFAEHATARTDRLAPKPANLSFEQAAALPVSGCAALHAVRHRGGVQAGQRVLVLGASGGVGSFAVQLAKAHGAEVTGVCRTAKTEFVRSLGADHVLDYTREDVADGRRRYDLIVDIGGNRRLSHLRRALTPRGTLVIVGGEHGGRVTGGFGRQIVRAPLTSLLTRQRLRPLTSTERTTDLDGLRELVEAGRVVPAVDRVFPLAEAAAAISYLRSGAASGKIVLTI